MITTNTAARRARRANGIARRAEAAAIAARRRAAAADATADALREDADALDTRAARIAARYGPLLAMPWTITADIAIAAADAADADAAAAEEESRRADYIAADARRETNDAEGAARSEAARNARAAKEAAHTWPGYVAPAPGTDAAKIASERRAAAAAATTYTTASAAARDAWAHLAHACADPDSTPAQIDAARGEYARARRTEEAAAIDASRAADVVAARQRREADAREERRQQAADAARRKASQEADAQHAADVAAARREEQTRRAKEARAARITARRLQHTPAPIAPPTAEGLRSRATRAAYIDAAGVILATHLASARRIYMYMVYHPCAPRADVIAASTSTASRADIMHAIVDSTTPVNASSVTLREYAAIAHASARAVIAAARTDAYAREASTAADAARKIAMGEPYTTNDVAALYIVGASIARAVTHTAADPQRKTAVKTAAPIAWGREPRPKAEQIAARIYRASDSAMHQRQRAQLTALAALPVTITAPGTTCEAAAATQHTADATSRIAVDAARRERAAEERYTATSDPADGVAYLVAQAAREDAEAAAIAARRRAAAAERVADGIMRESWGDGVDLVHDAIIAMLTYYTAPGGIAARMFVPRPAPPKTYTAADLPDVITTQAGSKGEYITARQAAYRYTARASAREHRATYGTGRHQVMSLQALIPAASEGAYIRAPYLMPTDPTTIQTLISAAAIAARLSPMDAYILRLRHDYSYTWADAAKAAGFASAGTGAFARHRKAIEAAAREVIPVAAEKYSLRAIRNAGSSARAVIMCGPDGEEITRFPSGKAAARALGGTHRGITKAIATGGKMYSAFWRYA